MHFVARMIAQPRDKTVLLMFLERASAASLVASGGVRGCDATDILLATHFGEGESQNRRLDGAGILVPAVPFKKRPLEFLSGSARCPRKASRNQH